MLAVLKRRDRHREFLSFRSLSQIGGEPILWLAFFRRVLFKTHPVFGLQGSDHAGSRNRRILEASGISCSTACAPPAPASWSRRVSRLAVSVGARSVPPLTTLPSHRAALARSHERAVTPW